jgi:hypothetical protein
LQVLSARTEYFLGQLVQRNDLRKAPLIEALYEQERLTGVISFLNANHTPEISDRIITVLKPVLRRNKASEYELRRYLNKDDLEKLSLQSPDSICLSTAAYLPRKSMCFSLSTHSVFTSSP